MFKNIYNSTEDAEIKILGYMVEIKMFFESYSKLPFDLLRKEYEKELSLQQWEAFRYRMIVSSLFCMISTWEQQIYDYCINFIGPINNNYGDIKDKMAAQFNKYPDLFKEIEEFRYVDNVLKHGVKSDSYKKLENLNSKFILKNSEFSSLRGACFNIPLLNINDSSVSDLCKIIEKFWFSILNETKNM